VRAREEEYMKKAKQPREPNYVVKIRFLQRLGALPSSVGLHEIHVLHDGWCAHLKGGICNCSPDIKLDWSQPAIARN
jgi:hypothetical protein